MTYLWPWLVIAGLGALHGLSPANGWMLAAACGLRARESTRVWRSLLPIAFGQIASIAIVALAYRHGLALNRTLVQCVTGLVLIGIGLGCLLPEARRHLPRFRAEDRAVLTLWSFTMATAQGAGLMLAPALVPMCLASNTASTTSASGLPLLALAVHMTAMLATTGAVASGVQHGIASRPRLLQDTTLRRLWTTALVLAGTLLAAQTITFGMGDHGPRNASPHVQAVR